MTLILLIVMEVFVIRLEVSVSFLFFAFYSTPCGFLYASIPMDVYILQPCGCKGSCGFIQEISIETNKDIKTAWLLFSILDHRIKNVCRFLFIRNNFQSGIEVLYKVQQNN